MNIKNTALSVLGKEIWIGNGFFNGVNFKNT